MYRIFLILSLIFFSCETAVKQEQEPAQETAAVEKKLSPAETFAANLSEAHGTEAFQQQEALSFDLELYFRGKKRLEATIISSTGSDRIRVEREDGAVLMYDGEKVWLSPDTTSWGSGRFDIFTWQYFALAPFKLLDPGTQWGDLRALPLRENDSLQTARLTFGAGTGDAPDDWYVTYANPDNGLVESMAYIVTFSKDQAEAEKAPHAISYHDYLDVEGTKVASGWKFWDWSEAEGLAGQLGKATLSNIHFVPLDEERFQAPEGAKEVTKD